MFLSLGPMPLANAFLRSPDEFQSEPRFPLDVYLCEDCGLVQLLDVIDPRVLFRNYIYVTGTSATMARHNRDYAQSAVERLQLEPQDLVVEIASNDGSLLRCFGEYGIRTLGIEPAQNIAAKAREAGIDTIDCFFNSELAREVRQRYGPAKAVIANNVLAHVDDPRDFLAGCKHLLAEDGLIIIEVPDLHEMVSRLAYDTIYHEHLCYFSARTLVSLCSAAGLAVRQIDHVPVHGGSMRISVGRTPWSARVLLDPPPNYQDFAARIAGSRDALLSLLRALAAQGKTIAGYGAPAKGNTLLNYCNISTDLLPYTVDKNPMKVGLYTPGMHIPVLPVSALTQRCPDYLVILPWNIADEVIAQQEEHRQRGGKFIIPVPEPVVV